MKFSELANLLCLLSGMFRLAADFISLSSSKHEIFVFWLRNLPFFS